MKVQQEVASSSCPSVCQRLPPFQHPAQDDLDASLGTQSLDPSVGPLSLDVLRLVLRASLPGADLLILPRKLLEHLRSLRVPRERSAPAAGSLGF